MHKLNRALLASGLLLIGLNLRIGVASVGPVLSQIQADTGLSETAVGLLTTIPVFAFGAFAFLTPPLIRRFGMHKLLGLTMIVLAAGIALRLAPAMPALFVGTIIVGAAIAIGNVVMPAAIKSDFAHRAGLMMGLYSTALFVGAAIASGLTVPLLPVLGNSWRAALAIWALPALLACVLWLPQVFRTNSPKTSKISDAPAAPSPSSPSRQPSYLRAMFQDRVALAVTAFMGIQSTSYYIALTWVPTMLQDAGMDATRAGWMLSFSAFPGIAGALLTPPLAKRFKSPWVPVLASIALPVMAYLGLALAPVSKPYLWMTLLGLGQGVAISLALSYIVWRSANAAMTGQLSTMAQGTGYLFAGLGPIGIGALYAATGGWTVPFLALGALLVLQLLMGLVACQDRYVLEGSTQTATV
ncbi:MFS transporter [Jonesiaceae bacterium BS-20]|uniref:MFS transporter n=1 Tax=Jonesiaceae bacterium BS-20 TaxID=3120821 RepID=A0AAU7DUC1_9MICO